MKKMHSIASTLAVSALSIAVSQMSYAQDDSQSADSGLEEVVVTGIRASLEAAADLKRNDARIMDAIVAEDIGKLPDNNVAEALQRVTGVSINRSYGVGNEVSIRGLNNNRVEINGRSTLGESRNGISFDDVPSAFLSAVEVIKSPTPEMIEGALGGTVNMKTVRPLDLKDRVISVSLDAEYADKTENWAPIFNTTFGDSWEVGESGAFGIVGSISYQDRRLRQDTFQNDLRVQDGFDINNDGIIDASDDAENTVSGNYIISREHKYEPWVENRERTAFNLNMQFAPNDRGNFYLDLNTTERDGGEEAYSVLMAGGTATNALGTAQEDSTGQLTGYVLEDAFILPKTWSEFRKTKSFSHAFGGEFDITDKLQLSFELSKAESDQEEPKTEFNWRAHDQDLEAVTPEDENRFLVDAIIDAGDGNSVPGVTFIGQPDIYLDQEKLALREFRHTTDDIFNAEDAFRFDIEYANPGDLDWFTSIKAGFRSTEREYERSGREFRTANLHSQLTNADGSEYIVWTMAEFNDLYPGTLVTPFQRDELFEQAGYASVNQTAPFVLYDAARLSEDLDGTWEIISELLEDTNREVSGTLDSNLTPNNDAYTLVEEETSAFYLQANMEFDAASIVFGGRFVDTKVTASAFEDDTLVSDTEKYSDFLPSLNITVDLSENTILRASGAKVMRRADFGQLSPAYNFNSDKITATRGNPGLEPFRATQFDFGIEHYWEGGDMVSATLFYKGVDSFLKQSVYCAYLPDLEGQNHNAGAFDGICILPEGAQGDSSTYSDTSDAAIFQQYVDAGRNGVKTTTVTNGSSGTIQGFELGAVYTFDHLPGLLSGFGVNANYTYSQSEDPDGAPLEDISENSYNIQLFWEHEGKSIRLAYTSRDGFLDQTEQKRTEHIGSLLASNTVYASELDAAVEVARAEAAGEDTNGIVYDSTQGNNFRDGIDQLDVSASWDVNDNLTLVSSITNLTGEPLINKSVNGTTWQVQESDRRFNFGLRYTF